MNKLQKYLPIAVIVLVFAFIGSKLFYNYQNNRKTWEEGDREIMVNDCMESLLGRAVRFPMISKEYCECTTDTFMTHYSKSEYYLIESKPQAEKQEEMLPLIVKCFNAYNDGMFEESDISEDKPVMPSYQEDTTVKDTIYMEYDPSTDELK